LQLNTKKRFVYGAIAFIWIVIPAFTTAIIAVTTDIAEGSGRCVVYGVYQSAAVRKTIAFFTNFINYFLPLAIMVFCYGRIVHVLRSKVFLADRTATQYDWLLASSCCPSVRLSVSLSVTLCIVALGVGVHGKSCYSVFLVGMFLFVPSVTSAVKCIF